MGHRVEHERQGGLHAGKTAGDIPDLRAEHFIDRVGRVVGRDHVDGAVEKRLPKWFLVAFCRWRFIRSASPPGHISSAESQRYWGNVSTVMSTPRALWNLMWGIEAAQLSWTI